MPRQHMARSAAAERARHSHSMVARVCGVELPECSVLRQKFFVRLLPDFDAAWEEAAGARDLDDAARASLRELRTSVEQAAERCLFPGRELRRYLRFCAHAVLIEMDALVPESQVDCALAWAAEAMRGAMSPVSGIRATCAPVYFRYQDLMAVPLSSVQATLASAACDGNPATALRRMPFCGLPAAARCSSVYLRFIVGVTLSDGDADEAMEGARWSALEEVARVMLGSRLGMPVKVTTAGGTSLYRAAHNGLRAYQAARLDRIVAGVDRLDGLAALLDLRDTDTQGRARLTLMRGRKSLCACMLQMPLDEGPAEMLGRIAGHLRDRGITDIASLRIGGACDAPCVPMLAIPV